MCNCKYQLLPVYKELYGSYQNNTDYKKYPQISKKDIVRNFPNNFMCPRLEMAIKSGDIEFTTTSGTTSDKMQIMRKKNWWHEEYINLYRQVPLLHEAGSHNKVIFTTVICSATSCHVGNASLDERTIGNILYVNNKFDPFSYTPKDVNRIIDEINFFQPYYMEVDAIYLAIFLAYKEKYNITKKIYNPKIMTLSYEFTSKNIKNYLRKYFKCPILDFYGTTEFGYLFLETENGMKMFDGKINVDFELLNKSQNLYSIIVTSEKNEYMPLLNYRCGDIAELTDEQLKNFKSERKILRIAGREKDITLDRNGKLITVAYIDDFISKFKDIILYQLEFINNKKVIFRYVTYNFTRICKEDEDKILNIINNIYSVPVDILYQVCIPPEMSGKFSIIKKCDYA